MSLSPVFTTFSRAAMPVNLLTVADWRVFAEKAFGLRSWESAAHKYAVQSGGALVLRADDRLVVFTRLESGEIRRTTHKPGTWGFDA